MAFADVASVWTTSSDSLLSTEMFSNFVVSKLSVGFSPDFGGRTDADCEAAKSFPRTSELAFTGASFAVSETAFPGISHS